MMACGSKLILFQTGTFKHLNECEKGCHIEPYRDFLLHTLDIPSKQVSVEIRW